MSNFGSQNSNSGPPNPDFHSFRLPVRPPSGSSSGGLPYQSSFQVPPPGAGTFQTIYGSFNSRMRQVSDFEPVKHRRSRKGCFTCRSRRVKCDEVRPRCQRCRKGKRVCVFPEEPQSSTEDPTRPKLNAGKQQSSNEQSSSRNPSPSIGGESGEGSSAPGNRSSSPPGASIHGEQSPSDDGSSSPTLQDLDVSIPAAKTLPEVQSYLEYFSSRVSHHHYGFVENQKGSYLRYQLAEHAQKDDALMYAIVAFTAYLVMVSQNDGSMEDFLCFYSSSMYMLRTSLQSGNVQRQSVTTLMTVLQLALLEEYLGDWVNLQAHKMAALSLMSSPSSMVQDPLTCILLEWYTRFDQFTAFMSQGRSSLGREWFQASCGPPIHNLGVRLDDETVLRIQSEMSHRLLGRDVSAFFVTMEAGAIGAADQQPPNVEALVHQFEQWSNEFEPPLLDQAGMRPQFLASALAGAAPNLATGDVLPEIQRHVWPSKHLLARFWTLELIFSKVSLILERRPLRFNLASQALRLCRILEDICNNDPQPDAILGISACLGIASLASTNDPHWASWCQEKFFAVVSKGYLYPSALRDIMSASFRSSMEIPAVVNAVREWIDERSNHQADRESGNIREMAGIIGSIDMREG